MSEEQKIDFSEEFAYLAQLEATRQERLNAAIPTTTEVFFTYI
jgi:hypothetical protein